jgi:hypothetical protein
MQAEFSTLCSTDRRLSVSDELCLRHPIPYSKKRTGVTGGRGRRRRQVADYLKDRQ